jgi:hypothetical protein
MRRRSTDEVPITAGRTSGAFDVQAGAPQDRVNVAMWYRGALSAVGCALFLALLPLAR